MAKNEGKNRIFGLLAEADKTYASLPINLRMEIEKICRGMNEFGPRKLGRAGDGSEFFEARPFRQNVDDPRRINARMSARAGKPIVVEREAEIRQHFYFWRDPSASMEYNSRDDGYTKKETAEIMMLAFAKHLAKNEELIGILDSTGTYRGGKAPENLAGKMVNVSIVTGEDMPAPIRKLPRHSTAVLFSDFMMSKDDVISSLDKLKAQGLKGHMVMVLDPQEIEFIFKGHVEFRGMEGEGVEHFKKAEKMRAPYHEKLKEHVKWLEQQSKARGFKLIVQRTDESLYKGLMAIYGMKPHAPLQAITPKNKVA